jgi:hypothetical protein
VFKLRFRNEQIGESSAVTKRTEKSVSSNFKNCARSIFIVAPCLEHRFLHVHTTVSRAMSVGGNDPKSQGTPPAFNSRPRIDPRPGRKVSFKMTKQKPSKTRYLSTSELTGIGLSVLLSMTMACAIVYVGINGAPIVIRILLNTMEEFLQKPTSQTTKAPTTPVYSRYITARRDLNCSAFATKAENLDAVIFQSSVTEAVSRQTLLHLHQSSLEQITLRSIQSLELGYPTSTESGPAAGDIKLSVDDFIKFEFSLNNDVEKGNFWVSDATAVESLPSLRDAGYVSLLPNSADSDTPCAMRSPPFADFAPAALTLGRNASNLSGGAFHTHRRSASLLLHGRKHWVIYPPKQVSACVCSFICSPSNLF